MIAYLFEPVWKSLGKRASDDLNFTFNEIYRETKPSEIILLDKRASYLMCHRARLISTRMITNKRTMQTNINMFSGEIIVTTAILTCKVQNDKLKVCR